MEDFRAAKSTDFIYEVGNVFLTNGYVALTRS